MTKFHAAGWRLSLWTSGRKKGTSLKNVILPSLACLTWKRLQIGAVMLLIMISTGDELFKAININDLECPLSPTKGGVNDFFSILVASHISRVNCSEMAGDRPKYPTCSIFSIERRLQQSKSRLPTFNKAYARGCQIGVSPKKWLFFCYWLV